MFSDGHGAAGGRSEEAADVFRGRLQLHRFVCYSFFIARKVPKSVMTILITLARSLHAAHKHRVERHASDRGLFSIFVLRNDQNQVSECVLAAIGYVCSGCSAGTKKPNGMMLHLVTVRPSPLLIAGIDFSNHVNFMPEKLKCSEIYCCNEKRGKVGIVGTYRSLFARSEFLRSAREWTSRSRSFLRRDTCVLGRSVLILGFMLIDLYCQVFIKFHFSKYPVEISQWAIANWLCSYCNALNQRNTERGEQFACSTIHLSSIVK